MTSLADRLRPELLPSSQLEELFFDTIVRLATCAHFLGQHIESDPQFTSPETTRRLRLLLSTESKLRYSYEEYRRLKLAHVLQLEDNVQAARPLLAVVATHTSRNGFRKPPAARVPDLFALNSDGQGGDSPVSPITRPLIPGRNAQCPCNSGRKYKHCCANGTPAVREGMLPRQATQAA